MCCDNNKNIYETFNHAGCGCGGKKKNCECQKESCGCPIKLPTECIRYTGTETDILKKNKNLEAILQEIEIKSKAQKYIAGEGIKATETPLGTIFSIDEEWLKQFIENL